MENEASVGRVYTPIEIDKITQLDRLCSTFSNLSRRYDQRGITMLTQINMEGNPYSIMVGPKFLYGLHLVRRSLVEDLVEMGLEDDAQDIFQKYLRQQTKVDQAKAQQEGRL